MHLVPKKVNGMLEKKFGAVGWGVQAVSGIGIVEMRHSSPAVTGSANNIRHSLAAFAYVRFSECVHVFGIFTHAVELIRFSLYGQLHEKSLVFVCVFLAIFLILAIYGYDPSRGLIRKKKI